MNLVRRQRRRRRGVQRPAVVLIAARPRPHAGVVGCECALRRELLPLPLERGCDLKRGDGAGPLRPRARNRRRAPLERLDERPALARAVDREPDLSQGFVEQERRRHESDRPRGFDPAELAVELLRVRCEAREIGFGVGRALDAMVGVEKARNVEIRPDVLDHDVR